MAVEDHKLFKKWDAATKKWHTRQEFYDAVKSKYGAGHPLVKNAKLEVVDAAKAVADIVDQL